MRSSRSQVIFTLDPDEGGFCKLAGLRFRLDGERKIEELLGKVVEVEVTVTDPDGDAGTGRRAVTLSQDHPAARGRPARADARLTRAQRATASSSRR